VLHSNRIIDVYNHLYPGKSAMVNTREGEGDEGHSFWARMVLKRCGKRKEADMV
jgi:hypothetical protein